MHRFFNNKKAQARAGAAVSEEEELKKLEAETEERLGKKIDASEKKVKGALKEESEKEKTAEAEVKGDLKTTEKWDKEYIEKQIQTVNADLKRIQDEKNKKGYDEALALLRKGNEKYKPEHIRHDSIEDNYNTYLRLFIGFAIVAQIIDVFFGGFKVLSIHFTIYLILGLAGIIFGRVIKITHPTEKSLTVTYLFLWQMFAPLLLTFTQIFSYVPSVPLYGFLSAVLTFFPALIIYGLWDTKYIGWLVKVYLIAFAFIIIVQYLILPISQVSIPEIGDIPTTDYSPTKAYTYMKNFIVGGWTAIGKSWDNMFFYATHGYYPGDTATAERPNTIELKDPITPNKLDYASNEPVVISAFLTSSNENTVKIFFSCHHAKASCTKDCKPTRDANVEPSFVKNRFIAEPVSCYPDLSESLGQNKVTIAAKGINFKTSATLTNYFTSQEALDTQLNRYFSKIENSELAAGIIDTAEKRVAALRDIYNINENIISVSDPGNVKLILYTKTDPVIGVDTESKDSTLSLVVVFENVAEGQIDAIESLIVKIPEGMSPVKNKCADFEVSDKNIVLKKLMPEVIATRLNFTKMPQIALLPCMLEMTNPDALLANGPNLATPVTFVGTITYDYSVKKEYDVKFGEEPTGGDAGGGGSGPTGGSNCRLTNTEAISKADLIRYVDANAPSDSIFKGKGGEIYDAAVSAGINPAFLLAIGIHEGSWGTSDVAKCKLNTFGYGAKGSCPDSEQCSDRPDCAKRYASVESSFYDVAKNIYDKWLSANPTWPPQRKSLADMSGTTATGAVYAEDPNWPNAMADWMNKIQNSECTAQSTGNEVLQGDTIKLSVGQAAGYSNGKWILDKDETKFSSRLNTFGENLLVHYEDGCALIESKNCQNCNMLPKTRECTQHLKMLAQDAGGNLVVNCAYSPNAGHSSITSLHYTGQAIDFTVSGLSMSDAATLAEKTGCFTWVYYEDNAHVHASVGVA